MKAMFRIQNPDDVEMSMTFTMPLARWKQLRGQLSGPHYPSQALSTEIGKLVDMAQARFEVDETPTA